MRVLLALLMVSTMPAIAGAQDPSRDAYLDQAARELVLRARARRVTTDRRIQSYQTDAVERVSVGLRAGIAEKLLYRRETATRIDWQRDGPVNIRVVGAREVLPAVSARAQVPFDLSRYVPHLAFDPIDSEMLLRFDTTAVRHPLAAGSETHYRFASGDSTVIRLPDGRTVRLLELRIIPRRRDTHLIRGSFWLDAESHAVVQAYFRLAREISVSDGPPLLRPIEAELDYIAIDYGLWDLRWWLPRTVAARGMVQAGMVRLPMSYERRYDDYVIRGDTAAARPVPGEAPVIEERPCRPPVRITVAVGRSGPPDTTSARFRRMRARQAALDSARAERRRAAGVPDSTIICNRAFTVTTADSAGLLTSDRLPASVYDSDTNIIRPEELRAIAERVSQLPEPPWQLTRPVFQIVRGPGLLRYNRVEGLAVGARAGLDLGRIEADAEARYGFADRNLSGEFGVTHRSDAARIRAAAYHKLDVMDFTGASYSLTGSLSALLFGSNDVGYFRTTGAELRITPPSSHAQWYDLRLFAEKQRTVEKNTDFSVAHLLKESHVFKDNPVSDAADQVGAVLRLRTSLGVDPAAVRVAAQLEVHGELGDFDFARPRVTLRTTVPLLRALSAGVEAEGGTSLGDATLQRAWHIGGSSTVRGYSTSALIGETFWRGRVELGLGLPVVRVSPFADAAWAGARSDLERGQPIRAVGIGASFMDALVRVDLARALDQEKGWKLHVYLNSVL